MNKTERVGNFTEGILWKKMIGFLLPVLGSLILITLYSSVDVWVVGRFGTEESISAVSTGSTVINLVVLVLNGLAMGVTILMGRYIGEGMQISAKRSADFVSTGLLDSDDRTDRVALSV